MQPTLPVRKTLTLVIMLVTLLTQSMALAFDSFAAMQPVTGNDDHHSTLALVDCTVMDCAAVQADAERASAPATDDCDQCHHCLDHGGHVGLTATSVMPALTPVASTALPLVPTRLFLSVKSLYRPPIV